MQTRRGQSTVIILLDVAGQIFSLPVGVVRDVLKVSRAGRGAGWRVRGTASGSVGPDRVIDVGGRMVPLIDLDASLGLHPGASAASRSRSVVVVQTGERWVGLLVHAVGEIVEVPREAIEPVTRSEWGHRAIGWVAHQGDRSIMLLDADRLLPPD